MPAHGRRRLARRVLDIEPGRNRARGDRRLRVRAPLARGPRPGGPAGGQRWRMVSFLSGLACVLVALVSPSTASPTRSDHAHGQHLLLLDLASVLCILGSTA